MGEKEESFLAKITTGGRITIPSEVRERLGLKDGNLVRIMVVKEKLEREKATEVSKE